MNYYWTDLKDKEIRIWVNGRDGKEFYSATINNKKQDGTYEHMYIDVQIPKDVVVNNGDELTIKKGFISFYKNKEGLPKLKLVLLEVEQNYIDPFGMTMSATTDDDELPF